MSAQATLVAKANYNPSHFFIKELFTSSGPLYRVKSRSGRSLLHQGSGAPGFRQSLLQTVTSTSLSDHAKSFNNTSIPNAFSPSQADFAI
ncbi:MAG: hypothetical protein AAF090_02895 [Bacteroidota bacterium]